ncbi:MAG: hypothetical protein F6K26_23685, partial [Moorea sp. SIO2I5]|nr:hypothetical protein [Moorena sp. SIO2I5]
MVSRETIGFRSTEIDKDRIQRVESDSPDVTQKQESLGQRVTKESPEIETRIELTEIPQASPDAIASEKGEQKRSGKALKPKALGKNQETGFPTENVLKPSGEIRDIEPKGKSRKGESLGNESDNEENDIPERRQGLSHSKENASAPGEDVTPREVVSRNVNPPAEHRVTELESPAPITREVKQLRRNEQKDSPTEDVLRSDRETREYEQKPSSLEWESAQRGFGLSNRKKNAYASGEDVTHGKVGTTNVNPPAEQRVTEYE